MKLVLISRPYSWRAVASGLRWSLACRRESSTLTDPHGKVVASYLAAAGLRLRSALPTPLPESAGEPPLAAESAHLASDRFRLWSSLGGRHRLGDVGVAPDKRQRRFGGRSHPPPISSVRLPRSARSLFRPRAASSRDRVGQGDRRDPALRAPRCDCWYRPNSSARAPAAACLRRTRNRRQIQPAALFPGERKPVLTP